jgi:hypothetical protein
MKVVGYIEIDGYQVFSSANDASADPEATKIKIAEKLGIEKEDVPNLDNYEELFEENRTPFEPGANQVNMEDSEAAPLVEKAKELNENQKLLMNGEIIPFYIGAEYYRQENGKWEKFKIEHAGEEPAGPLPDELTPEQKEEIKTQEEEAQKIKTREEERRRICCMSPEERAEALQNELDALADEAAKLEKRAQIQGKDFNPIAWYQEHAAAVREKYSAAEE